MNSFFIAVSLLFATPLQEAVAQPGSLGTQEEEKEEKEGKEGKEGDAGTPGPANFGDRMAEVDLVEAGPQAKDEYVEIFALKALTYTGGHFEKKIFNYRIYEPEPLEKGKKYPMIVWLHGAGESGNDNSQCFRWLGSAMRFTPERLREGGYYLLVPQSPVEQRSWFLASRDAPVDSSDPAAGDMMSVLKRMIEKLISENPIDPNRISLSGISSGGTACWEMAVRYPDLFSAIVPLSSNGINPSRVNRLRDTPVWAINNVYDSVADVDRVREDVELIKQIGGRAHLTEQRQVGHIIFALKYKRLTDWMLAQDKSNPRWQDPPGSFDYRTIPAPAFGGHQGWEYWQLLLQVGLPVSVFLACYFEIRRRSRESRELQTRSAAGIES